MRGAVAPATRERSERMAMADGELEVTITEFFNAAGEEVASMAEIRIRDDHRRTVVSFSTPTAVLRELVGRVEL